MIVPIPRSRSSLLRSPRQGGSTLVLAMCVIALLSIFIGLAFDFTSNTSLAAARSRDQSQAQALGTGVLDAVYKKWQEYMANNQASLLGIYTRDSDFSTNLITSSFTSTLNSTMATTGFQIYSSDSHTPALSVLSVDRTDTPLDLTCPGTGAQSATYASVGPLANTPGWIATTYTFRARVVIAKMISTSTPNTNFTPVTLTRYFTSQDASLFQAMLFFQNDLELHPGAAMTLYGLVHTNANFYAATSVSLNFSSNVSYHGNTATLAPAAVHPTNFYENPLGYVEGVTQTLYNQEAGTWNSYINPVYASSMNSQLSNVQSLDPLGLSAESAIDPTNPNASGTHEIIDRPAMTSLTNPNANTAYTDPSAFAAHRTYDSAGLRIIINRNNTTQKVHVYTPDSTNNENSIEVVPTGSVTAPNIADSIIAAITPDTTGAIYDFREGRTINADTVDMSKLTPALNAYGNYNGVVYITDETNADTYGNSGISDAIRLQKGGVLPNAGLTLASDGAVYIQGDYNTGTTYGATGTNGAIVTTAQPVSNLNVDPTQFTVTGYTQKPAAVMGDAVMILSNAWVDANSFNSISARVAVPTTVNTAIVSGQVLTTSTVASGGAHNFPRFLENWGGDNFTYHGSMCELYASTKWTGSYGKSNVYSAPNRRWFFDNNFLTTPPPGNLRSTTYARGRWVKESSDHNS